MVKRLLNLKINCLNKLRGEFKKNPNCFDLRTYGDSTLAYSGAKVQSHFYAGDLVTHAGDREIRSLSGGTPRLSGRVGMYAFADRKMTKLLLCS